MSANLWEFSPIFFNNWNSIVYMHKFHLICKAKKFHVISRYIVLLWSRFQIAFTTTQHNEHKMNLSWEGTPSPESAIEK